MRNPTALKCSRPTFPSCTSIAYLSECRNFAELHCLASFVKCVFHDVSLPRANWDAGGIVAFLNSDFLKIEMMRDTKKDSLLSNPYPGIHTQLTLLHVLNERKAVVEWIFSLKKVPNDSICSPRRCVLLLFCPRIILTSVGKKLQYKKLEKEYLHVRLRINRVLEKDLNKFRTISLQNGDLLIMPQNNFNGVNLVVDDDLTADVGRPRVLFFS